MWPFPLSSWGKLRHNLAFWGGGGGPKLVCFLFNIKVFDFQTNKKNLVRRGVATKRFFLSTCVLENVKVIVFFVSLFWANFG